MNKEMLRELKYQEAKTAAAKQRAKDSDMLLVDIADYLYLKKDDAAFVYKQMSHLSKIYNLNMVYAEDLIYPGTPKQKRASALTSIRLKRYPKMLVIVSDTAHNIINWLKTYHDNEIDVHVYLYDENTFYNYDEFMESLGKELTLDYVLQERYSKDRQYLENVAESFSAALGWKFSGPITEREITSDYFDKFKSYQTMSYAGLKGTYRFAETVHSIGDTFIEDDVAPGGINTITPSKKARLKAGKAVPTIELENFKDYVVALIDNNLLEDCLELGWSLCECGNVIRNTGETYEDAFCDYCSRPIPEFEATTYDEIQYQNYIQNFAE